MCYKKIKKFALLIIALLVIAGCSSSGGDESDSWTTADYQYLYDHNAAYLSGRTIRWGSMPVTVYAPEFPTASQAFGEWASASGGRISISMVSSSSANIRVSYNSGIGSAYCGLTIIRYTSSGYIASATVYINPNQSGCYGDVTHTLTHEAAHALGFFGHDSSGIMSPTGAGEITEENRRFFRLLYSMPPGTDITPYLGMQRMAQSRYDPEGKRIYTITIPFRCPCGGCRVRRK